MSIGDKFTGLNMGKLIGQPLNATKEAQKQLAQSTVDFIKEVGFDEQNIQCPLLSLVPIPGLHIDDVDIEFDMGVKESQTDENS